MVVGFSKEPEKIDETWTKEYRGRTYTFTKTRKGSDNFIYSCSRSFQDEHFKGDSRTGVILDHELTREEVESSTRFVAFMNDRPAIGGTSCIESTSA
jgi:hypothetical protein